MIVLIILVAGFLGYITGRISHMIGGKLDDRSLHIPYSPHHWVYGFLAIIISFFFIKNYFGLAIGAFGFGLIISDLNDLLHGRVFDPSQEPEIKKFWDID